jgi:cyclase
MNGRRNLFSGILMTFSLAAFATVAAAQMQTPPLKVMHLTGGVYWTSGGAGANTGFIVGTDGVIVVDAKMTADSAKEMLAEIAKVTSKPVTTVLITHSDGDHVNGLAGFPKGLTIIATENCKKEMEESENGPNPQMAAPKDYLPTRTVTKNEDVTIDGVHLRLLHFAPAHTSGDLIVFLPKEKIVFTGDILTLQFPYPLIHLAKNGSSEGWITTMKAILALKADTFVPGHGEIPERADLEKRLTEAEGRRAKIKALVAQGKTLDQVKEALGESAAPAAPGAYHPPSFTEVVYEELTKK